MKYGLLLLTLLLVVALTAKANAQKPESDPLKRAIAELQAGNTDKAIAALNEVISKHPDRADAYLLRGNLKMSTGDSYGALRDINKVIQLKPNLGSAYHERAVIRLLAKDTKGAIQDLDSAIERNYKGDHVYSLRGQLRSDQGDLKGALADFDQSMKLNPNNPQTYASRAGILIALEDRERALSDLDYLLRWYEKEPGKTYPVQTSTEDPKTQPGDSKKSNDPESLIIGIATETTNVAPGDKEMIPVIANAYVNRGLISSSLKKTDAAIADFTKAIRIDATNLWPFYHRANEYEVTGDLSAALADISRAIQLDPMNGNLRVEHGVILVLMGKSQEAQSDFDMLLNTDRALWQKRIDDRLAAVKKKVPAN